MLGDLISGNKATKDSTTTSQKSAVKDVIGGIVSGNKTSTDSTKTKATTTDNVKNVLGGLLGKKKKKDTVN